MKRIVSIWFFAALLGLSAAAQAAPAAQAIPAATARNTFIVLKSGVGDIQVKDEFAINGLTEEQDIASAGLFAGYIFDSGFGIEAGFSGETSDDIFESYDVFQTIAMVVYTFRPATDFTIVPKLGVSMWELDTFKSGFPFGESEEHSYDGTDMIWSVEGEYSLTKLVQLNLSYTQGNYDFGDLDSYRLGVEFDF
ncbi:MAG TPA: outer membrane beta-barrel protein [Gammaproteobacteria bacterium]|nr:outer membrane beta-barrel protein [Gammaproteobacteria bacterium]